MISQRFRHLVAQQLQQFADCGELVGLGVYVALPGASGELQLQLVHSWPTAAARLEAADAAEPLLLPDQQRRWLPLRREAAVIGALRVDSDLAPWPDALRARLQGAVLLLSDALLLDLEQQRLQGQLEQERRQRSLLVHQMRNPLAALRTFTQLLLRRVEPGDERRALVEHLLEEELALGRYLDALAQSEPAVALPPADAAEAPLLLPPALAGDQLEPLAPRLEPLLARAQATASLQGRSWCPPQRPLPNELCAATAVAEIIANLLENAFRYSAATAPVGLWWVPRGTQVSLAVWDGGPPIAPEERERIFRRGERGSRGLGLSGTGLGLALARDQAEALGGQLALVVPASSLAAQLPEQGNAFVLTLPLSPAAAN